MFLVFNTVYRIMVEIYFGKRRKRGTASSNERMNKDPPRAYWPGLENENEADSNPIHEKNNTGEVFSFRSRKRKRKIIARKNDAVTSENVSTNSNSTDTTKALLSRIEQLEIAASRIDEQHKSREKKSTAELNFHIEENFRLNSELVEKDRVIKDLTRPKRRIQQLFQSRLDEQFRVLNTRETIINKQKRELEVIAKSNEDLRYRIEVLEAQKD